MVDSTLPSSVTGGLTKIPLDPKAEVFGRLWQQAVEEFISRAQLSNDEKASICRHLTPEEAFNFTKRRWNNLNEKQLSRHQKGQRAVDTVLGIFSLIDGALGLAQVAFPAVSVFSGTLKLLHQANKNLANIYDLIETQFIAIHHFFERVHLNLGTEDIPEGLHSTLIKVLTNLLKICAIATRYAKTTSIKRTARLFLESLGPNNELHTSIAELQLLLNAETAIILSQVNRRTSDMYKELRETSATTKEISERTIEIHHNLTHQKQKGTETSAAIEQLSVAMDRVEAASGASHASLEEVKELIISTWQERNAVGLDNELAELRSWLEPVEHYEEDYIRKLSLRGPDTCDWVFSPSDTIGKALSHWLNGVNIEPSIVWLIGSPGQGKSVLAAYLIKTCKEKNGDCLFFFCRQDDEAKRSISNILRTVAYSLAVIERKVKLNYLAQKSQGVCLTDMSPVMLWERLFKNNLMSGLSKTIHWVIDGFDELEDEDRGEFASLLAEVAHVKLGFKVLVVSREDRELEEALEHGENVRIVKLNKKRTNRDIRKFITSRVGKKFPALSEEARMRVIDGLTKRAGALFLWATLALKIVCRKRSERTLFEALDDLPLDSQMKSLYSVIFRRISNECADPGEKEIAKALHMWTLCSFRPLSLRELKCALELKFGSMFSLSEFKRTVRDFGGSLIEVGDDMNVTFAHATVKEFLLSEDAGQFRIVEDVAHRYISGVCLDYLTGKIGNLERTLHSKEDAMPQPDRLQSEYHLLYYAAQYVFNHIQASQKHVSTDFVDEIISFLEGGWCLTWIEALGTFGSIAVLPLAANTIKAFQSLLHDKQTLDFFSQVSTDLLRIALQIDEKISEHPRSIHISLSSMFPRECLIAQRARHDSAKCLHPELARWSPIKAYRGSGLDPAAARVTMTFTPCGMFLVFAQLHGTPLTVDIVTYQTQTYQPIIRLDPLVDGKSPDVFSVCDAYRTPVGIPVGEPYRFFEVRCSSAASNFRVLAAYSTERGYRFENELYLKCIFAEHTSESPYQGGKWRPSVPFDFPVSHDSPRVHIAMNSRGPQILAWGNRKMFFWRDINAPHITFAYSSPILAADFTTIDGKVVILCIMSQGLRIRDLDTLQDRTVPHNFGPATEVLIDTLAGHVLLCFSRTDSFIKIQLGLKSNGYSKSIHDPRSNIRRYLGSLRSDCWNYVVWESSGRRLLVRTDADSIQKVYPNPVNSETVVPSIQRHRFVIIDDLSEPPLPTSNGHNVTDGDSHELVRWQAGLRKQEEWNRFWLHGQNFKISPCTMYVAFAGCDLWWHPENCRSCKLEPSRIGIGDCSSGTPTTWFPTEEELDVRGAKLGFAFDRYSRLFIFADHGRGIFIYSADIPRTKFKINPVSPLRHIDDVILPLVVYAQSRTTILFVCYSSQKPMEIWKLDTESRAPEFQQHLRFDNTCVVSAEIHSSVLVFVTSVGWLCSLDLNDQVGETMHHFRLPADLLLPNSEETDLCKLKCTVDGVVRIRDMYGEKWKFWVATIAQVLQSVI